MKNCPDCGYELSQQDTHCPSCKKLVKHSFTIRNFIFNNFRLFTIIGTTGTMISLIPNMGTRILGTYWITDAENILPLLLSIIIFFGAVFLTICFLMIFSLVFQGRSTEDVKKTISLWSKTLMTVHEGDFQRFILLFCLVPMWFGIVLFFVMLMPLIPNKYSWLFATITVLTCIPLVLYSFLGWKVGKKITGMFPGLKKFPRISIGIFTLIVVVFLIIIPFSIPRYFDNADTFSENIKIQPDQQYFSPHISTAKGLRLDITNLSGRELLNSRHSWSANYGYFIRVIPSTSEVTILGNPVYDDNARNIYWTYPENDPGQNKKPVKIELRLYRLNENVEITNSSLYLTWYDNNIAYVNSSFASS